MQTIKKDKLLIAIFTLMNLSLTGCGKDFSSSTGAETIDLPSESYSIDSIPLMSASANYEFEQNIADLAIDGDEQTYWSAWGSPREILVEFDGEYLVTDLKVSFRDFSSQRYLFDVELLIKGQFIKVLSDRQSDLSQQITELNIEFSSAVTGLRIVGKGNSENQWNSINEIEVLGQLVSLNQPLPEPEDPESPEEPADPGKLNCGSLADGETEERTRFQSLTVAYGQTCAKQIQKRSCDNGDLSEWSPNNFVHATCTVDAQVPPPSGLPTANSITELKALLDQWKQSMDSAKTVVLKAGTYDQGLNLKGYKFAKSVTIQGEAPADNFDQNFTQIKGTVDISGSQNVSLKVMKLKGGLNFISVDNCTNCLFEKVWIEGQSVDIKTEEPVTRWSMEINGTNNLKFKSVFFKFFKDAAILVRSGNTGLHFEDVLSGLLGADFFKIRGDNNKDFKVINNWQCRTLIPYLSYHYSTPQPAHTDFLQIEGDTKITNLDIEGNIVFKGKHPDYLRNFNEQVLQGVYISANSQIYGNTSIKNNVIATNTSNGIFTNYYAKAHNATVQFNTLARVEMGDVGSAQEKWYPVIDVAGASVSKNFVARPSAGGQYGQENGGHLLVIGAKPYPDFSSYDPWFMGRMNEQESINSLRPRPGSKLHWDYQPASERIGAYQRLKEIFVEGKHPGNQGWPVALPFHHQYNFDDSAPSNYTGNYNADGSNR